MNHGKMTEQFGLWLTQHLKAKNQYSVFYDHGNPQENPNVAVIKGFFGKKVTNRNRITDADVVVVKDDKEVVLLIEIEESRMSPKKLLGDIFGTLLCNYFAVRQENGNQNFRVTDKTVLIIAGVAPNPSDQEDEIDTIRNIVMPRLQKFSIPDATVQIGNIKIVTDEDILKASEKLKNEVISIFDFS